MDRRNFFKTSALAAGASLTAATAEAGGKARNSDEDVAILVDTTKCIGCRECEGACAERNELPERDTGDESVFEIVRRPTEDSWVVINRFEVEGEEIFVRKSCMHCVQPACVSACLTKAMYKTPEGPVIWRADKCMGCRFCMVSCPFDIPAFEYHSANPKIQKCRMCSEQLADGVLPACVDACPEEAIVFGTRKEMLDAAWSQIYENRDDYVHDVFGERDAGGTGLLYLAAAPFEKLGFRDDLGETSYPELTQGFLYSVPAVFTLWPAVLLGIARSRNPAPAHGPAAVEDEE